MSKSIAPKLVALALAIHLPATALAGRCEELARPRTFDANTAMEAIFCHYDRVHGGTLLPFSAMNGWRLDRAEQLATPHLVATWMEGGQRKGVLVVQRQLVLGEVVMSHATGAELSAYVFRHDGSRWVFEKGHKSVAKVGAHGMAPGGRLIRLGEGRFGIWFEGGDVHQGYTNDYAFVVPLSEPTIVEAKGLFDTGQSNSGACSDEQPDEYLGGRCWGYRVQREFLRGEGAYWTLRLRASGTRGEYRGQPILPEENTTCYRFEAGHFLEAAVEGCATGNVIPEEEVVRAGEAIEARQPAATIPRKQLGQPPPAPGEAQ